MARPTKISKPKNSKETEALIEELKQTLKKQKADEKAKRETEILKAISEWKTEMNVSEENVVSELEHALAHGYALESVAKKIGINAEQLIYALANNEVQSEIRSIVSARGE